MLYQFFETQREEFQRLGVLGDWKNPYLTMAPSFEAGILKVFRVRRQRRQVKPGTPNEHMSGRPRCHLPSHGLQPGDHEGINRMGDTINLRNLRTDGGVLGESGGKCQGRGVANQ